jgi:ElaA protein
MQIEWVCKAFDELKSEELYAILQLRNEVFVVEQNCVFQDADNKDQKSMHLMGYANDKLLAYTRLINAGIAYDKVSIGRVVTSSLVRSTGIGKQLMEKSIEYCYQLFGKQDIKIGAQLYLEKFYESFGFKQTSDIYDEDGIDHIEMIRYAND